MRVALLVDREDVDYHTYQLYQSLVSSEKLDVVSIVRQHQAEDTPKKRLWFLARVLKMLKTQGLSYLPYAIAYKFILVVERARYRKLVGPKLFNEIFQRYNLGKEPVSIIDVTPIKSKNGLFYSFSSADIAKIVEQDICILIRCGSGIHKGDILNCTKFGIISFHHGDNRKYRGGPTGFWEVFDGEEYTGFIIQKLTDELDGGHILMRGEFSTQNYYVANQMELWRKSTAFLIRTLEKIATAGAFQDFDESQPYSRRVYKYPNFSNLLTYICVVYVRILINKILSFKSRFSNENYFLLYGKTYNWKKLEFRKLKRVPPVAGRFFADPFPVQHEGDQYIFFEDFCLSEQKGKISYLRLIDGELGEYSVAISSNQHLSFPFIFEHQDQKYMVPECVESNTISLYRCLEFPKKWEKICDLVRNVRAADPMVIYRNQKFWLFCNIDTNREDDFSRELHIYFSDDLFANDWKPHWNNPFVNSPRGARNGGIIDDGVELYRVGQISTIDTYGKSFLVHKITELTDHKYSEKLVYEPNGLHSPDIRLSHHFSVMGGLAVMDGFGRWGHVASRKK